MGLLDLSEQEIVRRNSLAEFAIWVLNHILQQNIQ